MDAFQENITEEEENDRVRKREMHKSEEESNLIAFSGKKIFIMRIRVMIYIEDGGAQPTLKMQSRCNPTKSSCFNKA